MDSDLDLATGMQAPPLQIIDLLKFAASAHAKREIVPPLPTSLRASSKLWTPDAVIFDAVPLTATGKIDKKVLRMKYFEMLQAK